MHPDNSDWPGCHGVRLEPDDLAAGYGSAVGEPLRTARIAEGPAGDRGGFQVWHLKGEVSVAGEPVAYDQRLTKNAGGIFTLRTIEAGLRVDPRQGLLTIDAPTESLSRQLITTYGLPLLLLESPCLVLHACAAVPPSGDRAVIVCGSSGSGKSSLVVGLISSGWNAVSEDLSVVDLRNDTPMVWPGPPWVRREGEGPPSAGARFETADKTAWDIARWQVDRPMPIARVVFLDRPGGDSVVWESVDRSHAIASIARFTSWLGDQADRAKSTFGACVKIAGAVEPARMRLPVTDDWLSVAESTLRRPIA